MKLPNALLLSLACVLALPAQAEVWFQPGDARVKADLEILADAGVLDMPVMSWPVYLPDVKRGLASLPKEASETLKRAYAHINHRLAFAMQMATTGRPQFELSAFSTNQPHLPQTFDKPLETRKNGVILTQSMIVDQVAARLQINTYGVDDLVDWGDQTEFDGSYLTANVGKLAVTLTALPYWWGPGNQANLILGNAPAPMKGLHVQTRSSAATKALPWLGHWNVQGYYADMDLDTPSGKKQFMALRASSRWEFGLEVATTYTQVFLGGFDGARSEASDERVALDARWSLARFGWPVSVYGQVMGDSMPTSTPKSVSGLYGADVSHYFSGLKGYVKAYAEVLSTQDYLTPATNYTYAYQGVGLDRLETNLSSGLGLGATWVADAGWDATLWHKREAAIDATGLRLNTPVGKNTLMTLIWANRPQESDPTREEASYGLLVKRVY